MSGINETRFLVQHELSDFVLNESVYNSNQKWNHDACLRVQEFL